MTIELGIFGLVITIDRDGNGGGIGTLKSDLSEPDAGTEYMAAIDGIESLVLAHACAGVAIDSPAYIEGIETAVNACANNF